MKINNANARKIIQKTQGLKDMDSNKIKDMANVVKNAVNQLCENAQRQVPENMSFAPVVETFKNISKEYSVKEFVLKIIADPVDVKNSRRVLLEADVPDSDYIASLTLAKGKKADLIKEISQDKFSDKVLGLLKDIDDAVLHFENR